MLQLNQHCVVHAGQADACSYCCSSCCSYTKQDSAPDCYRNKTICWERYTGMTFLAWATEQSRIVVHILTQQSQLSLNVSFSRYSADHACYTCSFQELQRNKIEAASPQRLKRVAWTRCWAPCNKQRRSMCWTSHAWTGETSSQAMSRSASTSLLCAAAGLHCFAICRLQWLSVQVMAHGKCQ